MKKGQIVESVRGAGGGYILTKDPKNIKISDVIAAIDEPIKMTRCKGEVGCIDKKTKCKTHHLWQGLEHSIYNYLSSISIANINDDSLVK